jgi:hypothetical protein
MTKIKDPEINRVLVLSTGHLTKDELQRLNKVSYWPVYDYGYGLFVWVPEKVEVSQLFLEMKASEREAFSSDLKNILEIAMKLGCQFVRFDCDGPLYEELPQYDWE